MQKEQPKVIEAKKLYQIGTSLGKLTVEVNAFKKYFFLVVTYSALLKVDGSLQIAQKTPYSNHPTVLSLSPDCQASSDRIAREVCKQTKLPVILSLNIQLELSRKGQDELIEALCKLCRLHLQQQQQEQQ